MAVLMAAGCAEADSVPPERAVIVEDDARHPSGTPLGGGFEVEPGSALVGAPFPIERIENGALAFHGFKAFLVVTGDPYRTFRRYIERAERLGIPVARSGHLCAEVKPEGMPPSWVECYVGEPLNDDVDSGRRYAKASISLRYGSGVDGTPLSHIILTYVPGATREANNDGPTGRLPRFRVQRRSLPKPGQAVLKNWPRFKVLKGSRLAATPM
jgi:hypothetical protein